MCIKQEYKHNSKKKKNTYIITNNKFNMDVFAYQKSTPLIIAIKNGKPQIQPVKGTNVATLFPNPHAIDMANKMALNAKNMGSGIATTIIEYLDYKSNKPVLQLYPNDIYIFDNYKQNWKSRLNHATRQNLTRELKKRNMNHIDIMLAENRGRYI